jgi:hypothetical protein
MKTSRPAVLTLAALLLGLISLSSLATPLLVGPPLPVKVLAVVTALNALAGAPGLFVQPNLPVTIAAGVGIAISVLIIVLAVLPSARQAYA